MDLQCLFVSADGRLCGQPAVVEKTIPWQRSPGYPFCEKHKLMQVSRALNNRARAMRKRASERGIVSQSEILERSEEQFEHQLDQWEWDSGATICDQLEDE